MSRTLTESDVIFARAEARLPGGNTRAALFVPPRPPFVVRGEGYEVVDADGHRLIDLGANYTTLVHGHAHPVVTAAAAAALADGACFGLPSEHEVVLAERLAGRVPALERLRYANSGTEAVMMAIRAARAFTGRPGVLRFEGCYHGVADAVLPEGAKGLTPGAAGELVTVPGGETAAFDEALDRDGERLACVLIDLMPNRAGLEPTDPAFVEHVRRATREHGILLVVDEVITFRLETGGLQQRYGLVPDLVTLGKVIGGGFAVGAFGGRADVMAVFDPAGERPVAHGGTFTANPITMRAGLAAVELLDAPAIARINSLGDRLRVRLSEAGFRAVGSGSLVRVLADDPSTLWWRLYEAGVLLAANGLAAVSTVMDEDVVDEIADRFERVAP